MKVLLQLLILQCSDSTDFSKYVIKLFEQVKRINIFISDLDAWEEGEIISYEEELKKYQSLYFKSISKENADIN